MTICTAFIADLPMERASRTKHVSHLTVSLWSA